MKEFMIVDVCVKVGLGFFLKRFYINDSEINNEWIKYKMDYREVGFCLFVVGMK